jgi:iron complex outermembrane receptor protein
LFRLVAGFEVGHTNLIGSRATVTYHGMSDGFSRRMQVLVDGRSIYTPATGGIDWYGLPVLMDDIERIEITRGPNGVTYGANSFLGVINILTYHPDDVQGTLVKAVSGDDGYRRNLLRHAGKQGALDYRISLEYQSNDGNDYYRDGADGSVKDDKEIQSGTIRADYRSDINDYLTLQLGASDGTVGDGFLGDITQPLHENSNMQYFAQVKWKRIISSEQDFELQFYQNYSNSDADYFIPKLSDIFSVTPADIVTFFSHADDPVYVPHSHKIKRNDIELVHRSRPVEAVRLVWGAEARQDEVESPGLIGANSPVTNRLYRFFANGEWSPSDDWIINAGVMAENNEITDTHFSPRLAANYRLNPNHSIRTSYSVNYRTPAVLEEYADYGARFYSDDQIIDQIWKSAGDLEPEKNTSYEVALVGNTANPKLGYDIRLFRDHFRNLIAVPVDNAFLEQYSALCGLYADFCRSSVFANDGHADMSGIEVQTRLQATEHTILSLGLSHVSIKGEVLSRMSPDEYASLDVSVPRNTISVLLDHMLPHRWQVSAGHYQTANMSFIGGDETGGIKTTDIRLAKHIVMKGVRGKIAFVAQDINGTYFDFREDIPRSRTAYINAELNF